MSAIDKLSNFDLDEMIAELERVKAERQAQLNKQQQEEKQSDAKSINEAAQVDFDDLLDDRFSSEEDAPMPLGLKPQSKTSSGINCSQCKLAIFDEPENGDRMVEAFGEFYHDHCLRCSQCDSSDCTNFVRLQRERRVICQKCASTIFVCCVCNDPIIGASFTKFEDERMMHVECVPKQLCGGCQNPIAENEAHMKAIGQWFHPHCFSCASCNLPIDGRFSNSNGKLQCETCLTKMYTCTVCKEFIAGRYLKLKNGDLMHPDCAPKEKCTACKEDITLNTEHTVVLGEKYHLQCLKCAWCEKPIEGSFGLRGEKFCCADCFSTVK